MNIRKCSCCLLILSQLFILSCKNKKEHITDYFSKSEQLKHEFFYFSNSEEILNPVGMMIYDSLLFIQNLHCPFYFSLININQRRLIKHFGNAGEGPGEFIINLQIDKVKALNSINAPDMVDITGLVSKQIVIVPDSRLMEVGGITLAEIETALNSNNGEPGSMSVRDGHYEYNIRFSSVIRTLDDIRNIYIRKNDRIYKLSDLAQVNYAPEKEKGMAMFGDKRCIKMAIIKQSGVKMADMPFLSSS